MNPNRMVCFAVLCVALASGCSTFSRDWQASANVPLGDSIEGRWDGSWKSDVNGHTGRLRCMVTKIDGTNYQARFHAKYRRILSFRYTVGLAVESKDGQSRFEGDADLGWLAGGKYRYEGHASATNFFSTYTCKYDHGTFAMNRPAKAK